MPTPTKDDETQASEAFRNIWTLVQVSAETLADMKALVKAVRGLKETVAPRPLETAVFSGSALAKIVELADKVSL